MYAIIESGGKQYRVSEGDLVDLERFPGEIGEQVNFDRVLLVGDGETAHLGTPLLATGQVVGTITEHGKQDKVMVFKFKRRKGYRRKRGHRQQVTSVRIEKIALGAASKPPPKKTSPVAEKPKKAAAKPAGTADEKPSKTATKERVSAKKTVTKKKATEGTKSKSTASKKTATKKKTTKVAKKSAKKKD
ncbi:MAG: 50S ribosomal protein L21 [Acidobacteriota bacterium]